MFIQILKKDIHLSKDRSNYPPKVLISAHKRATDVAHLPKLCVIGLDRECVFILPVAGRAT